MEKELFIPSSLLKSWEDQAIRENIPYTEFAEFIRMKQRQYEARLLRKKENKEAIAKAKFEKSLYADDERNILSEYGNKVALAYLLAIPQVERICKFARFDFEDLQARHDKIIIGKAKDKDKFLFHLEGWYNKLKSDMKEYRLSKETLSSYGLDFKAATNFYFAAR